MLTKEALVLNSIYGSLHSAFTANEYHKHDIAATEAIFNARQPKIFIEPTMFNEPVKVIFNDPATIVLWDDGTKTVVKCYGEKYDKEKGLAMCYLKKAFNKKENGNYYKKLIKPYIPKEEVK